MYVCICKQIWKRDCFATRNVSEITLFAYSILKWVPITVGFMFVSACILELYVIILNMFTNNLLDKSLFKHSLMVEQAVPCTAVNIYMRLLFVVSYIVAVPSCVSSC